MKPSGPSGSVIAAGVVAILASLVTILIAVAAIAGMSLMPPASSSPPLPQSVKSTAVVMMVFLAGLAIFGIFTDTGENAEDCPACQEDHHHDGRGFDGLWKGRRGARWRHQAHAGDRGHSNEDRNQAGEYGDNSGGNDRTGWSRGFHGSAIYHFRGCDDSAAGRGKSARFGGKR